MFVGPAHKPVQPAATEAHKVGKGVLPGSQLFLEVLAARVPGKIAQVEACVYRATLGWQTEALAEERRPHGCGNPLHVLERGTVYTLLQDIHAPDEMLDVDGYDCLGSRGIDRVDVAQQGQVRGVLHRTCKQMPVVLLDALFALYALGQS